MTSSSIAPGALRRLLALLARIFLKPGPAACGPGSCCRKQAACGDHHCPGHPRNN